MTLPGALGELLWLPPDRIGAALALLAFLVITCEYARVALHMVGPRSRSIHLVVQLLTVVVQPVLLAVVLWLAIAARPERALADMGYVALMYPVWYVAGKSTLLARPDSQGPDVGFMAIGAFITFVPAVIATLVY